MTDAEKLEQAAVLLMGEAMERGIVVQVTEGLGVVDTILVLTRAIKHRHVQVSV